MLGTIRRNRNELVATKTGNRATKRVYSGKLSYSGFPLAPPSKDDLGQTRASCALLAIITSSWACGGQLSPVRERHQLPSRPLPPRSRVPSGSEMRGWPISTHRLPHGKVSTELLFSASCRSMLFSDHPAYRARSRQPASPAFRHLHPPIRASIASVQNALYNCTNRPRELSRLRQKPTPSSGTSVELLRARFALIPDPTSPCDASLRSHGASSNVCSRTGAPVRVLSVARNNPVHLDPSRSI